LQGTLRLYCVPACFLQPPCAPPLLEQRLAPQLQQLAASVPLVQPLSGTTQLRTRSIMHGGVAWWYPCPQLRSKVMYSKYMPLSSVLWGCLADGECSSLQVVVKVMGPAAAAAAVAAAAAAQVATPAGLLTGDVDQQQQRNGDMPASTSINSSKWAVMQQEEGFTFAKCSCRVYRLSYAPAWRRLLPSWGSWHLFKAQAVRRSCQHPLLDCELIKAVAHSSCTRMLHSARVLLCCEPLAVYCPCRLHAHLPGRIYAHYAMCCLAVQHKTYECNMC
jgi:hypothetical protein